MIAFIVGMICGAVVSALVLRNNAARVAKLEDKGKAILDALKGRTPPSA